MLHWPVALNPEPGVMIPLRPDGSRDIDEQLKGRFEDTWAAMEKLLETGKVKNLGVANFSIPNLERLLKTAKVVPAVNQVELHRRISPKNQIATFTYILYSLFTSAQTLGLLQLKGYSS